MGDVDQRTTHYTNTARNTRLSNAYKVRFARGTRETWCADADADADAGHDR
jgi:hypothetical protein